MSMGSDEMEFYTQNGNKRPVRLSEKTRQFACDSLNRKYGLNTLKRMGVSLDGVEDSGRKEWIPAMEELERTRSILNNRGVYIY